MQQPINDMSEASPTAHLEGYSGENRTPAPDRCQDAIKRFVDELYQRCAGQPNIAPFIDATLISRYSLENLNIADIVSVYNQIKAR